jgi:hypothetical protein
MTRTLLGALASFLLFAAPATAASRNRIHWEPQWHHQAKPQMTFGFAKAIAVDYWARRGVRVACEPEQMLLSDAETADWGFTPDMLADVPACAVDVTPWAAAWRTMPGERWYYCREIVHEVGHLAGLGHDYGGVMDEDENIVPWSCSHPRRFARRIAMIGQLEPQRHKHYTQSFK